MQSGGSEMEAIHEAYRQISHAGEDSEDHHHNLSLEEKEGSNWLPSPPQHAVQSLQPASTTESGQRLCTLTAFGQWTPCLSGGGLIYY